MAWPESLDPRTVKDIREREYGCCDWKRPGRWAICQYHEGYDAALEQHAKEES